jgi:hypothetical protein
MPFFPITQNQPPKFWGQQQHGQTLKPGSQKPVATPLCGVFAFIANRAGALLTIRRWIACSRIVSELSVER